MHDDPIAICDAQGNLTGEVMPFHEVHDKELWHQVILVWLYNSQGEVLLQHRAATCGSFANVWDVSASGHIKAGDSAIASAVRELREELDIQVKPNELAEIGRTIDSFPLANGRIHHEYGILFLVHRDVNLERMEFQTAEVDGARWMSLRDLAADMDNPDTRSQYSSRNPEVYRLALEAIWNLTAPD